jgi:acetyl-CoA C-acetyltransferase
LIIEKDEVPDRIKIDRIPTLKAAFKEGGTITAATSSSISDGAAALMLMPEREANKRDLPIYAYIKGHATHSQEPKWFTTAPVGAVKKLSNKIHWKIEEVDLFEINEAFAVVTLAAMKELNIPHEKVNIHGGACALGHPIGASGARILVTLLHAMEKKNVKRGMAAICIGGGEATAIAVERPS